MSDKPRVGTAVWIIRDGTVLLGKRERGAEVGSWCPPGGGVDMYESPTECAIREVFEETGLTIRAPKLCAVMSDANVELQSHWVTLHFVAKWESGEPHDTPGEIGNWTWYTWDSLPDPLFFATRNFVKNGYNPLNFQV